MDPQGQEPTATPSVSLTSPEGGQAPIEPVAAVAPAPAAETWRDGLPEEIRHDPNITKYESLDEMARGHINTAKMVGANKVGIPGHDATEDDWGRHYDALGRPQNAEGYSFTPQESAPPEGYQVDAGDVTFFGEAAHSAGLSTKQADAFWQQFSQRDQATFTEQVAAGHRQRDRAIQDLRLEYGLALDDKIASAKQAFLTHAPKDMIEVAAQTGLDGHPAFIKMWATIAEKFAEDGAPVREQSTVMTPARGRDEIARLQAHPAYLDKAHPEHADVVRKLTAAYEAAFPEEG